MRPQTSLYVSTPLLRFDVPAAGTLDRRQTTVEFTAAARTARAGEVVVTVEPAGPMEGPGGAADVEDAVSFSGDSDGTLSGVVTPGGMQVAARWTGSGVRHGRLVFTLSRSAQAGSYVLPVRFLLITP
jgi:hypothetical protein